jgi:hypothetical protein
MIRLESIELCVMDTEPIKEQEWYAWSPYNYMWQTQNPWTKKYDMHATHTIMCDRHWTYKPTGMIGMEPIKFCSTDIESTKRQVWHRHNPQNDKDDKHRI